MASDLADQIDAAVDTLVPKVLEQLVLRLPAYGAMPLEQLAADVQEVIARSIHGFATALRTTGDPTDELLAYARDSATRRGEEGIGIEPILDAYLLGIDVTVEYLRDTLLALGPVRLLEVMQRVRLFQHQMQAAVAAGFLEQRENAVGETQAARSTLLNNMVEGVDVHEAARRAGVALPESYLVLAVHLTQHPDERDPAVDPMIAMRRKVRRVRQALDGLTSEASLDALTSQGGIVLLPQGSAPLNPDAVHHALSKASGVEVRIAYERAIPARVSEAVRRTHEVLDVVRRTGAPPGSYQLSDVLLEYQLSRPSDATRALAARLDPIKAQPVLRETLTAYLANRRRRRATAAALHVHPNTVDNRLHRIKDLTGLDPLDADDLPLLRAVLAAHAFEESAS